MEWSKYVLSVMVGGCLLVLYGKKGTGRNKWLFGAGTGTSLMAMELAVEYMLNKAAWEMALSIMKRGIRQRAARRGLRAVHSSPGAAGGEGTAASGPAVDEGIPGKLSAVIKELLHDAAAGGRPGPGGTAPAASAC